MANGIEGITPEKKTPGFKSLNELIKAFESLRNAEQVWRNNKTIWEDFYDGNQLSGEERSEMDRRNQPAIVINKIKPRIDLLVGLQEQNRPRVKAFPRNPSEDDEGTAAALSEAFRYIDQNNSLKFTESEVFMDGLISGRGWFGVSPELDETGEMEIKIKNISSSDIFLDPLYQSYDLKDAVSLAKAQLVPKEDLIALFPDKKSKIEGAFADNQTAMMGRAFAGDDYLLADQQKFLRSFIDESSNRLKVIEYWFKTKETRKFILVEGVGIDRLPKGTSDKDAKKQARKVEKQTGQPTTVFEKTTDVLRVQTFILNEILEEKEPEFLGAKFPYVPFVVYRERKSGRPYGPIKAMIDPQSEINKRRSKGLHLMNTERVIMEDGAVNDPEVMREELAKPDGIIEHNRNFKLSIERNLDLTNSQLSFYQAANSELDQVTGINPDLLGSVTNARSGTAIQQRQTQGLAVLNPLFNNWKRTRILLHQLVLDYMQQFWTGPKAIRVTDDQGVVDQVILNQTIVNEDGEAEKLRNISDSKFDIILDEMEDSLNFSEESFRELAKLVQTGQVPPEILLEFSTIPFKVRQRLQQQLQQQREQQQALLAQAQGQDAGQQQGGEEPPALPSG